MIDFDDLTNVEPVEEKKIFPELPGAKPTFRQSNLVHYFTCPKKYDLATKHDFKQSDAMREGLIFETFVLGHKKDANTNDFEKNVIGRKKADTIEAIRHHAEEVKNYFIQGEPFVDLRLETEFYNLKGEADYIGDILFNDEVITAIADLKYTSDINKIWNTKTQKKEFLQAIVYPYMYYKKTGVLLPFVYILVQNTYAEPLVKQIKVEVTEEDFSFIENLCEKVSSDMFFEAIPTEYNCLGWKGFGACQFFQYCQQGQNLVAESKEIRFSELLDVANYAQD